MTQLSQREASLYYGSTAVCGGALGLFGVSRLYASGFSVVPVLVVIGGLGMLASAVLEWYAKGSETAIPDRRLLWLTVGGAVLAIAGTALALLN